MHFKGRLYRALNPLWATQPPSSEGAARFGGRFNLKGQAALYCSLSPLAAMREANQAGSFQPITLVAYEADLEPIFDARAENLLLNEGMSRSQLALPDWRETMRKGDIAPTQQFARHLVAKGYCAMMVPSFAPGADTDCINMVLWSWGGILPSYMRVIDDEDRLQSLN